MAYLDQAHDPRRRGKAIVAVAAIHAVLGYTIVTGLGAEIVERFVPPPLKGEQIPLPPPPPKPVETPEPQQTPITYVAPPPRPPVELTADPLPSPPPAPPTNETSLFPSRGEIGLPPAPPPGPSFPPKRAVPRNNSSSWIGTDDYPRRPLVEGIEGSVGYRLVIGTNGRVSSCELTRPSGNRALDDATCRLITTRARFEPATDETGAKVLGTFTGSVRWEIPE
jgi:protein TonB